MLCCRNKTKHIKKMNFQKEFQNLILSTFCILIFSLTISFVGCNPPENHIKCSSVNSNCTITNTYGSFPDLSVCRAARATYPRTEEELVSIVANATKSQTKMKVATTTSHSIPKIMCPGGENGIIIGTKFLNRTVSIDASAMTITVEPGMTLRQLINVSANAGLTLAYTPYWWGLTVGGLLGTGAHGSTLWGLGSGVHDYVVRLRIVTPAGPEDGYAKVRTLEEGDPELNAARVSLGVLGVISQVTLQLEPLFKRSISYVKQNDSNLGSQVTTFGKQHEFADFQWYPTQNKVMYRFDDRVPITAKGNAILDSLGFQSTSSFLLALVRSAEETQESIRDAVGKCINGALTTTTLELSRFGLNDDDGSVFNRYPVVGYNNRLQSSGSCLDSPQDGLDTSCAWDPRVKGIYYFQTTFSISLSKVRGFIEDVQKLNSINPRALCGLDLYNGLLMRYVTTSKAYLGKEEDSLDFDITYYRSKDPTMPRLYEDFLEEIEQMAIFKYNALPHWGKNRNVAFIGAINKYKNATEFLKVKTLFDPLGLFSNEWTDQILGLKDEVTVMKPGCALDGLCICTQDDHCAPRKGYFCRPGKVYNNARVCTRLNLD